MTEQQPGTQDPIPKYPFRIQTIFFEKVQLKRAPKIPEELEIGLSAEIAVGIREGGRDLAVRMRVTSPASPEPPLSADVVAVGLIEHIGESAPADSITVEFINEHLLVAMSSMVIQLIGTVTVQMGMPPVWLPHPRAFALDVQKFRELAGPASGGVTDAPGF